MNTDEYKHLEDALSAGHKIQFDRNLGVAAADWADLNDRKVGDRYWYEPKFYRVKPAENAENISIALLLILAAQLEVKEDPYREFREAAAAGKEIEVRRSISGEWYLTADPKFDSPPEDYRVFDEYRELKEAFADGKTLQFHVTIGNEWVDMKQEPAYVYLPERYRVKTWEHAHRALEVGEAWCQDLASFVDGDLPDGYRPLLRDENVEEGDEYYSPKSQCGGWVVSNNYITGNQGSYLKYRTRRPMPLTRAAIAAAAERVKKEAEEARRADFEVWAKVNGYILERARNDEYFYTVTRSAYEGYCAGRQSN